MKLSVAIITFNEERNIERCLLSVKEIADEIVVVDSFSKDRTRGICETHGAKFLEHVFEGHIQQKNYALSLCKGDWILSLDADEALDDELKKSIRMALDAPSYDGFRMNRLTNYCGHWVRYCGWYPDTKLRFVKNGKASWQGVNPHDRLELNSEGQIGFLTGDILHYSYYTHQDHLKQIEYFSGIASKELFDRGVKTNYFIIVGKVIAQFNKSFFLKTGFLDGWTGVRISVLSAYATWRKYIKLKQRWNGK
jgi:glycosyltransferase involved in cell wall biosynthesis